MSRKHFKIFADAIAEIQDMTQRESVAFLVANACKQANSRFDYHKFYAACGIEK